MLADPLFWSILETVVDMAKDSAFALANIKAMRLVSVLSHLPPAYKTASKVALRKFSLDSNLLFEDSKVLETIRIADKAGPA